ncbi:transmembrane protein 236-like [Carcharodon carcharias]|uniref:transmembrane protein 236-like n=1 Tax=Carcharodon carcharias TaxID=13397 RepID=UPI001B7E266D|nr:transmembrane protein 236-like [Carcharodon carcharias]
MISGNKIKFVVFEVFQFAALCAPTIVVAERFASIVMEKNSPADLKSYQLIVACSVAYVACVSLIIWIPLKFLMFKKRILSNVKEWQPALLMQLIFTTLPCFGFIIAGSQAQYGITAIKNFSDLPVSLVIMCLILVSIIENLRKWQLTGKIVGTFSDSIFATDGPVLTNIEQISAVSAQQDKGREENQTAAEVTENEIASSVAPRVSNKSQSVLQLRSHATSTDHSTLEHKVPASLKVLAVKDYRAEVFVTSIINWLDTVELVRVAGLQGVFTTGWVYPIYIFSYLSLFRIVLHSANPLLPSLAIMLQDFPFFFVRVSLIGVKGFVTPVLYPLKNIIVITTFIYFNYVTKCKYFNHTQQF